MPDMVETERFFPVKGETPICSEIRVCICVAGEFDQHTMHHSIDTIQIHNMRSQFTGNFVLKWKEVRKTERRTKDDT